MRVIESLIGSDTILNLYPLLRKVLLMILFVPLAGEINFYPSNATVRVSLAPHHFLFLLFLMNRTIIPGFLTALAVVAYRIF
ncbi:hypothetical protein [Halalkalibacter alkalisediminis]|uniref:Uncharacterized protein n=1 Tax=Halalkalibacter alkalisediminis TaxID=935616 RepID=A0ABV6NIE9_9BACI|nr:hypothetical protein [Halalkalibacter alkalisediminis]